MTLSITFTCILCKFYYLYLTETKCGLPFTPQIVIFLTIVLHKPDIKNLHLAQL